MTEKDYYQPSPAAVAACIGEALVREAEATWRRLSIVCLLGAVASGLVLLVRNAAAHPPPGSPLFPAITVGAFSMAFLALGLVSIIPLRRREARGIGSGTPMSVDELAPYVRSRTFIREATVDASMMIAGLGLLAAYALAWITGSGTPALAGAALLPWIVVFVLIRLTWPTRLRLVERVCGRRATEDEAREVQRTPPPAAPVEGIAADPNAEAWSWVKASGVEALLTRRDVARLRPTLFLTLPILAWVGICDVFALREIGPPKAHMLPHPGAILVGAALTVVAVSAWIGARSHETADPAVRDLPPLPEGTPGRGEIQPFLERAKEIYGTHFGAFAFPAVTAGTAHGLAIVLPSGFFSPAALALLAPSVVMVVWVVWAWPTRARLARRIVRDIEWVIAHKASP